MLRSEKRIDVVLVGREQPGDENLALRYLAAALLQAGHRPHIVPLAGPEHLPGALGAAIAASAPLLGVSIPDADAAVDALAFVRALRDRGYRGHVTAGGALATLVRAEILAAHPGFDSIVRHDGEVPIIAIAERIARGATVADVPGVTTRAGDGPPAPVLDPLPLRLRPLRPKRLPRILGVPVARLLASRGCPGRCPYCGPAALQRQAIDEGLRGGADRRALREVGVGGLRRRPTEDVADEVAELHERSGARFFHLLDDNLLADGASEAAAWLRRLTRALRERGVTRTAWSLQMDPATLEPETVDALEELGVVRVLLGIEAVTSAGLRSLGRPGDARANLAIAQALAERGVVTLFNDILVHPSATPESIAAELEGLPAQRGVHFDALSMAVYPGTEAFRRLCERGEVSGGFLGWRFEPRDPVVARFRAALIRLRLRAIGRYGVNVLAHDVAVNLAVARRLGLATASPSLERTLEGAVEACNRARVDAWRAALALASADLDPRERSSAVDALVTSLALRLAPIRATVTDIEARLERLARVPPGPQNLLVRSALAAGFTFLLAPAAACGGRSRAPADAGPDAAIEVDAGRDAAAALDAGLDASSEPDASRDAGGDAGCTPEMVAAEWRDVLDIPVEAGCPQCVVPGGDEEYGVVLDAEGRIVDVRRSDGAAVAPDVRDCYLDALAGQTFPCLAGDEVWQECVICLF